MLGMVAVCARNDRRGPVSGSVYSREFSAGLTTTPTKVITDKFELTFEERMTITDADVDPKE